MSDNFKIYNFIFLSYHWLVVISALIEVGRDPLLETHDEYLQQKYNYFISADIEAATAATNRSRHLGSEKVCMDWRDIS